MASRRWLILGAGFAALSVALGALAAHGLEARLDGRGQAWVETAVRYAMWHSLALLALAWLVARAPRAKTLALSGWCFVLGIILFSGGLCLLALTGTKGFAHVVPFGGLAFLAGWIGLVVHGFRGEAGHETERLS